MGQVAEPGQLGLRVERLAQAAARSIARAAARHSRASASSTYGIATRTTPGSRRGGQATGPTGFQASVWSSRVTCPRAAAGRRPARRACIGARPASAATPAGGGEPRDRVGPHALEPTNSTQASSTGPVDQTFGPRRASIVLESHSERLRSFDASRPIDNPPGPAGSAERFRGQLADACVRSAMRLASDRRRGGRALPPSRPRPEPGLAGRTEGTSRRRPAGSAAGRPAAARPGPARSRPPPLAPPGSSNAAAFAQPPAEEVEDLPLGPAALPGRLLVEDDPVEGVAQDPRLADDDRVAAVAVGREHDGPPSPGKASATRRAPPGPRGCARSRRSRSRRRRRAR